MAKDARADPTRATRRPIKTNARPVPRAPNAAIAASEPQSNDEPASPTSPNGAVQMAASPSMRPMTGRAP